MKYLLYSLVFVVIAYVLWCMYLAYSNPTYVPDSANIATTSTSKQPLYPCPGDCKG